MVEPGGVWKFWGIGKSAPYVNDLRREAPTGVISS